MKFKLTPMSMQRPRSSRRPLFGAAMVVLALGSAALAGCSGSDGNETAFAPAAGNESAYCDTYRAWQVHEIDGGEGPDQPNPAALEKYWNETLIFKETSLQQAPPAIRDELVIDVRGTRTLITPLLEKYEFDLKRIEREGSAAEQALLGEPPADVQKAEAAIDAYQGRVCQAGSPPAADVVFKADESSKPFCTADSTFNSEFGKVASSRFDPGVMRTFVTADSFTEVLDALDAAAPAEIAADVKAETEWFRNRWSDVTAEFGYDIRRILLDATPEDRAVFTRFHPDVAEHESRITAYAEQVCGG